MLHKHHIIPKHMGGTDDPENLIEITVEEHAEIHRKLYEEHGFWQDYLAWQGLSKRIECENMAREAARLANSGKIMTEETRNKISKSKKGKKHSKQHIENNRKAQTGKVLSEEHRSKISSSLSGRSLSESHKINVGKKMKNRIMSDEWKRKLSEAAKKRHARNREIKRSTIDSPVSPEN